LARRRDAVDSCAGHLRPRARGLHPRAALAGGRGLTMENNIRLPLKIAVAVLFLFLLVPVIVVIPLAFSGETTLRLPPSSFSLRWYGEFFGNARMLAALRASALLGIIVTAVTLSVALPAAYVIVRLRSPATEIL